LSELLPVEQLDTFKSATPSYRDKLIWGCLVLETFLGNVVWYARCTRHWPTTCKCWR